MGIGIVLVLILGIPALLEAIWFGYISYNHYCVHFLVGPTQCGPSLYFWTVLGVLFFLATVWLAWIWRD